MVFERVLNEPEVTKYHRLKSPRIPSHLGVDDHLVDAAGVARQHVQHLARGAVPHVHLRGRAGGERARAAGEQERQAASSEAVYVAWRTAGKTGGERGRLPTCENLRAAVGRPLPLRIGLPAAAAATAQQVLCRHWGTIPTGTRGQQQPPAGSTS
ncbi:hypothetical protein Agub_g4236 [Astrephomene gubernaculifera]|uniref:Uncharacterized protein n=1 Tax=Astrephomene gubernaculifera TaxID=47775 RepID=A0AAD3DJU0_9CHLO|nr:hypothetical protein Agub_g4236 [Astrephomene gubernaculifera]